MMTRYEAALRFLEAEKLPPKQTDNLGVLEGQVLKVAQDLYTMTLKNLEGASLEEVKQSAKDYFTSIHGLATFLLIVGVDIHHFRMASLSRYLEVPPEMQIEDIINRLTTRCCDLVGFDDAPNMCIAQNGQKTQDVAPSASCETLGDVVLGKVENKEKGKEEGKEENSPPHPPKGERARRNPKRTSLARARKGSQG